MKPDLYEYTNLSKQWVYWKAFHFWLAVTLGALVWGLLSGGAYVIAGALLPAFCTGYEIHALYQQQKLLREHKESIAKTQDILSRTTIG